MAEAFVHTVNLHAILLIRITKHCLIHVVARIAGQICSIEDETFLRSASQYICPDHKPSMHCISQGTLRTRLVPSHCRQRPRRSQSRAAVWKMQGPGWQRSWLGGRRPCSKKRQKLCRRPSGMKLLAPKAFHRLTRSHISPGKRKL